MIALLREPIPPGRLALLSAGIAVAVALYCVGYSALAGRPHPVDLAGQERKLVIVVGAAPGFGPAQAEGERGDQNQGGDAPPHLERRTVDRSREGEAQQHGRREA